MQFALRAVEIIAAAGIVSSSLYYLLCLWSAADFLRERKRSLPGPARQVESPGSATTALPAVSILKPLKGMDPEIYESLRSHCLQEYPEYEIVFGVGDPNDPAVATIRKLQQEFPRLRIELIICPKNLGANAKVSNLEQMLAHARHGHLIVNDSDIRVEKDYLRRVLETLAEPGVGLVTCLYRGIAAPTLGSRLEALGISTDFAAGVLVARKIERGIHFGLGSTLAFHLADLERMGGFEAIVDYLGDDYELGKRIAGSGLAVVLSPVIVETYLPAHDLKNFLSHQMRWARNVRDARASGYLGLMFTFGIFWSLLALVASGGALWAWLGMAAILMLRIAVAIVVGREVLGDRQSLKFLWLIPLRDLIAVGTWAASFAGNTVRWRGDRFRLKNGKLTRIGPR